MLMKHGVLCFDAAGSRRRCEIVGLISFVPHEQVKQEDLDEVMQKLAPTGGPKLKIKSLNQQPPGRVEGFGMTGVTNGRQMVNRD